MTVGELGRRMSSRELVEWRALAKIEREEMDKRKNEPAPDLDERLEKAMDKLLG